jgi:phage shock protein C
MEPKRLYRSITDRKLAGVAGGLAEYFMIDPLLTRLIFVVLTLAGGGGVLIYIVLWIVTPEQHYTPHNINMGNQTPPRGDHPENEPQKEPGYSESTPFATPVSKTPLNPNKGSLIGGLVLITLGALFLADQLIPQIQFEDLWPIILIVVGVGLLIKTITKKNQDNNPF